MVGSADTNNWKFGRVTFSSGNNAIPHANTDAASCTETKVRGDVGGGKIEIPGNCGGFSEAELTLKPICGHFRKIGHQISTEII